MRFRLTVASLLAFAAAPAFALDCSAGFRAFDHALGETCIPESPQRIASLRDDSITTPLMDMGAPVFATISRDGEGGPRWVRGAADIFGYDSVEATGLIDLGGHNPLDVEAVAVAGPDLIILRTYQQDAIDQLQAIAPAIVIPDDMAYFDHMEWLADAAGMTATFEAERAAYQARIDTAKARIGDPGAIVVSRFDMWDDGLWYYPNWGAIDQVINDIGFSKPALQAQETEGFNGMSVERVQEFDGDLMLASIAPRWGQTETMLADQWDSVAPFWRELDGVKSGNLFWYERDIMVGYTFESLNRSVELLTLLTAGRDFN
ncbi:ABC transporter substrate-binding protein [Cognatiyoonia sp. IB215446]|uniref:ABC transporter substrate-binding protein n=1 Tax=Cognatiyoonia sp. IB215446 TaxID=3097355 RepID=UPI002A1795B8|nr:ABC transporter substrate-binding protein [Cognatiyoonia sp. IB215446]MDX8350421.1 ABC transporter substrate-binding protein [Cognatiyoonia sp. IB215446]